MFKLVAAAIVGGVATFWGPLVGLLYLTVLEEVFRDFTQWIPLLWGVSVLGVILLAEGGLEMVIIRLGRRAQRWWRSRGERPPGGARQGR